MATATDPRRTGSCELCDAPVLGIGGVLVHLSGSGEHTDCLPPRAEELVQAILGAVAASARAGEAQTPETGQAALLALHGALKLAQRVS